MRLRSLSTALTLLALVCSPVWADTGFLDRDVTAGGQRYRFEVYVPSEHTRDRAWAVLIDLHGNGAQGSDGIRQTAHFLPEEIRMHRATFPLLVIFPQAAPGTTWTTAVMQDMVMAEADAVIAEFHGDPDRVYVSGFSMGGIGACAIAARWPERFAAAVAIGGVADDPEAVATRVRRIPWRVYHGESDERVPVQSARQLVSALRQAGAAVEYIEYRDTRHGPSAEKAYAEQDFIPWLLTHTRPRITR